MLCETGTPVSTGSPRAVAVHTSLSVCHCELYERKRYVKNCGGWSSCGGADEDSSCREYGTVENGRHCIIWHKI